MIDIISAKARYLVGGEIVQMLVVRDERRR